MGEFPSKIIVAGGLGVDVDPARKKPLSSVEIYDSTTKTWSAGPELPQPLFGAVMVQYGLDEVNSFFCYSFSQCSNKKYESYLLIILNKRTSVQNTKF